jgi:hypothetical protein
MRQITILLLIGLLVSSCNDSKNYTENTDNQDKITNVTIEISEQGLFLNSKKISLTTDYNEIKSIIGTPTKEKIQSTYEIEEKKQKFGSTPNNIYTYDNYGILIYQKAGEKEINSISIDFKKQNYVFSPSTAFSGILKINGVSIDRNTSLTQLKKIEGLLIGESTVKVNSAKFNNHVLTFEFNSYQDKNGLVGFSIDVNNIPEQTNAKGWTDNDIKILKASISNLEQIKTLSIQYDYKIGDFADCYAEKISTTLTMSEMENQTIELQKQAAKIIEDCIIQTSNNQ